MASAHLHLTQRSAPLDLLHGFLILLTAAQLTRQARMALSAFAPHLDTGLFDAFVSNTVVSSLQAPLGESPSAQKTCANELFASLIPSCGAR